jgi:DNA-binding transcriptional LysR family regulator
MDRLTGMAIFAQVVEAKSFSVAARRLGVSKSTVSKQIARLEDRLGARLLNRTTRRLSLTEVGAAFHERCARIMSEVEAAEEAVSRFRGAPHGVLRVNAPLTFGLQHLMPVIPEFLSRWPGLCLELLLDDRVVDLVDGAYDVGVRIGRLSDSSLVARRLAPNRLVVCGAPEYLARRGVPRTPEDLADHDCLCYTNVAVRDVWRFGPRAEQTVRVRAVFRSNSGDALQAAAVAGLGLVQLPSFIVWRDLRSGALVPVLERWERGDTSIHALYPHGRHLSPKVRVFVGFLASRFGPRPYWDRAA